DRGHRAARRPHVHGLRTSPVPRLLPRGRRGRRDRVGACNGRAAASRGPLTAMAHSLLGRIRVAAALAWAAHPAAAAGAAVLGVLSGAAPVATAWLTKLVLDAIIRGDGFAALAPAAA